MWGSLHAKILPSAILKENGGGGYMHETSRVCYICCSYPHIYIYKSLEFQGNVEHNIRA
jgi:hypothetical protein